MKQACKFMPLLNIIFNTFYIALSFSAPPDRGLATQSLSGKKKNKFRFTLGFACNADGSEKLPICYIGKSAVPRCFKGKPPTKWGFDYHYNKKAWMTMEIFEKYVSSLF